MELNAYYATIGPSTLQALRSAGCLWILLQSPYL